MSTAEPDELLESNSQYIAMMGAFARRFPGGKVESLPGLSVNLSGTPFAFMNVILLSSPVRDAEDLAERGRAAVQRGRESGQPWLFTICDAWAGEPGAAHGVLGGLGIHRVMGLTGMVTDELAAPRRPAPEGMEIRPVRDEVTRMALGDLNCTSYGLPVEMGRATIGQEVFWGEQFFGHIGFVKGVPVTCTLTVPLDGRLYVSCVATHPEHRQKGYAEAVMRRSLEETAAATGHHRTVLHATEIGRPLYAAMGYRAVTGFGVYVAMPSA